MLLYCRKYWLLWLVFLLLAANVFLFYLDWQASHRGFTFAMLDVGQGDALFIESPTGTQVLFDGGPPRKILGQLSRVMSPFDRSIDALVITDPDQDHVAGFSDVLRVYQIGTVFESGTVSDSKTYQNLKNEIVRKNIPVILVRKGMKLDLGGGVTISILFPDRDVSGWASNDGSVIARLSYGDTSVMLTGDATTETESIVLGANSAAKLRSTVLKVGHHGSRTSTSREFFKTVSPLYALISAGPDNRYGHPHQDVLQTLTAAGAKIFRTDLSGTIVFECDIIAECKIKKSRN